MNAVGTNPHENVCPKIGGKLLLHFDIGVRYSVTRLGDFLKSVDIFFDPNHRNCWHFFLKPTRHLRGVCSLNKKNENLFQ